MVTTTRATSSVPGTSGRIWYGDGADEHFFLWRSLAPRKNTGLLLYVKPGHTFNMGERVMDPHTSSSPALGTAIDLLYDLYDWPIVSLELRPPHSADSPRREPFDNRPWPGPLLSLLKFIVYLRENANNEDLWGPGGSFDVNKIAGLGSSSGHTLLALAASIPPGAVPIAQGNALTQGAFAQDHRPNAVIGFIGQIDWTQFAHDPSVSTGPFSYDVHQYFFGKQSSLAWRTFNQVAKRSASPWWWRQFIDPSKTAWWQAWGQRPNNGPGRNLTPELWLPGKIQNGTSGTAFFDPHHYFQAKPWAGELERLGCVTRTIWGTNSDNPTLPNNDSISGASATAQDIVSFFQNRLRW